MPTVFLPRLLDPATGGQRRLEIEGDTVAAVLAGLVDRLPGVEVHLFDHRGDLRPHVLCFIDGESSRLVDRQVALAPAAQVRFLQAVSGG